MSNQIRLSVHQLVDFLLRKGDIDTRIFNRSSMNEGTLLHNLYQSKQGDNYISEYPLKTIELVDGIEITIEGRADGIIKESNSRYIIDEIKTTITDLKTFAGDYEEWHLGQAKLYAYMFAKEQSLPYIEVKLTYIKQGKEKDKLIKNYAYKFIELDQYVHELLDQYLEFNKIVEDLRRKRDEGLNKVNFPFSNYRTGQKELSKYCYAISKQGGKLFVEAPTGIGKTMSTLFPLLKSLLNDEREKIFYLTAKTSGKNAAFDAVKLVNSKGTSISALVVTARDKICFCKDKGCNPDECPFAKGYYSKIQALIKYAILSYTLFDYETLVSIARDYEVCPFELELDLSLFTDVIICDYNYLFDPISYMHRYFDEDSSHYLALIDESHNLVDRSRDMYSSSLKEEEFKLAKKSIKECSIKPLKTVMAKFTKRFNELKRQYDSGNNVVDEIDNDLVKIINRFCEVMSDVNINYHNEVTPELLEFYLNVSRFKKIIEFVNSSYLININIYHKSLCLDLLCLDASSYLRAITSRIKGSIYFSATLSPIDYYIDTLGGDKKVDPVLKLDSPFPVDNLLLLVAPKVSVKYKNRESSYSIVKQYIDSFIKNKVGNYLVFVPSYEYLENIKDYLVDSTYEMFFQEKDMEDIDKEVFISKFETNPTKTRVGFAILGGSFSEGIDLVSDRLIGAVIVGIGMPKINFVSDKVSELFDSKGLPGNDYAYVFPGMNKVMQAVGRVIRDENDKGSVLLIDERYMTSQYQELFKKEWRNYEVVFSPSEIEEIINNFYNK